MLDAEITINGKNNKFIMICFYERGFKGGSVAFGGAYMDGWWDAERLDELFEKIFNSRIDKKINPLKLLPYAIKSILFNSQRGKKSFEVGEVHYDIGNDLYSLMLDKRMTYTSAYWDAFANVPKAKNLDEAQEHKLEIICRKIGLKKGDKILDIGCGWGSFVRYAAEKYGAQCVGISISKEQIALANATKGNLPIEFRLQDYRDVHEKFDHIISIGMFEHVGYKNYKEYIKVVHRNLKDDGLFLLHTIGRNTSTTRTDPWIHKYIFPNSMLPSIQQIAKATEKYFVVEDWHNFGIQYDYTLMAW